MKSLLVIGMLAPLVGCAPMISGAMNATVDENVVLEKTAKYFGAPRESIAISSIEKGPLSTSYQAKYAGYVHNCSIYYGEVNCKQAVVKNNVAVAASADSRVKVPVAAEVHPMTPAQAQARLNELGYNVGAPDGIFGKKSVEKLKLFQKSRGLTPNGKLDDPTIAALR